MCVEIMIVDKTDLLSIFQILYSKNIMLSSIALQVHFFHFSVSFGLSPYSSIFTPFNFPLYIPTSFSSPNLFCPFSSLPILSLPFLFLTLSLLYHPSSIPFSCDFSSLPHFFPALLFPLPSLPFNKGRSDQSIELLFHFLHLYFHLSFTQL